MDNLRHLRINTGGALEANQVFGRAAELRLLLDTLRVQSILLLAERRTGKTSLLTLLEAQCPADMRVLKMSVEGVASPTEFVERLHELTAPHVGRKSLDSLVEVLDRLGITGVGKITREANGAPADWKGALRTILKAMADSKLRIVIVLDELSYAVQRISTDIGPGEAREVLDILREARQNDRSLRFIYAGSIGLHHVIGEIRAGSWAPTNDLSPVSVGLLRAQLAERLARALLENEFVSCDTVEAVANEVARISEGVPFFVHHLVSKCKQSSLAKVSAEAVTELFEQALDDPQDPLAIRHLEQRLRDYYGPNQEKAAILLDIVAEAEPQGISFQEIARRANTKTNELANTTEIRQLLEDLKRDHYLRSSKAHFQFRLNLLRTIWRRLRYLD